MVSWSYQFQSKYSLFIQTRWPSKLKGILLGISLFSFSDSTSGRFWVGFIELVAVLLQWNFCTDFGTKLILPERCRFLPPLKYNKWVLSSTYDCMLAINVAERESVLRLDSHLCYFIFLCCGLRKIDLQKKRFIFFFSTVYRKENWKAFIILQSFPYKSRCCNWV